MSFIKSKKLSMIICFLMIASLSIFVNAEEEPEILVTSFKLTENIFMLTGLGGNMGVLIGDEGTFLIDHQSEQVASKIKKKLNELSNEKVICMLNTHYHRDHTGYNKNLKEEGVKILAHSNVHKTLSSGWQIEFFKVDHEPLGKNGFHK